MRHLTEQVLGVTLPFSFGYGIQQLDQNDRRRHTKAPFRVMRLPMLKLVVYSANMTRLANVRKSDATSCVLINVILRRVVRGHVICENGNNDARGIRG